MPSRRHVLSVVATAVPVGLAGCSGSSSSNGTVDCHTSMGEHGDGDLLDTGATADVVDGDVHLRVPLALDEMRATGVDRLVVTDAAGDLAFVVPVDPSDKDIAPSHVGDSENVMTYEQYIGPRPQHGRYRLVAVDAAGAELDSLTIDFNCFAAGDQ